MTDINLRTGELATSQEIFMAWVDRLPWALRGMGYPGLREGQSEIITNTLLGLDAIGVLPTGGGKSATFILPAVCAGWKVLIFSPLIALMEDQVSKLTSRGLLAACLNSTRSQEANRQALSNWVDGRLQFLYAAPERINAAEFLGALRDKPPQLLVLDEAHCLSGWSDSFRPEYALVGGLIKSQKPRAVLCLTATCTEEVEADIRRVAGIGEAPLFYSYPERKNLKIRSATFRQLRQLENLVLEVGGPCLVYCATVKNVTAVYNTLQSGALKPKPEEDSPVVYYHGKADQFVRQRNMDRFMAGDARVMVCTNAFGLGVDKPDIRHVIHRDAPGSLEAYVQEIGRGGRDGGETWCSLLIDQASFSIQEFFLKMDHPSEGEIRAVYQGLELSADPSGLVRQDPVKLGARINFDSRMVSSAINILCGVGVITKMPQDFQLRVKLLQRPKPEYEILLNACRALGIPAAHGYYQVDLTLLCSTTRWPERKIRDTLWELSRQRVIDYIQPFYGQIYQITGGMQSVDTNRLKERKHRAWKKLDQMREFVELGDEQKPDFIANYFDRANRSRTIQGASQQGPGPAAGGGAIGESAEGTAEEACAALCPVPSTTNTK